MTMRRKDSDGTEPLDDPASEAIAQFFAAPRQFRKFDSAKALAENLGVSRMTVYRRAEDADVVRRMEWLLRKSMRSGDLIACRVARHCWGTSQRSACW
jgi:HTH domain